MKIISLDTGWLVRYEGLEHGPEMSAAILQKSEGWLQADLPCDIHMPLIKSGLIKEPLEEDKSRISKDERRFAVVVNGVTAFCKGSNWIPADSIYARVTDEKYKTLIIQAKEANFNMLRVWGGGLYERDIFYEKCDQYGILLWHDFMFACAMYPDNLEWFRNEVANEMEYQTIRLRTMLPWLYGAGIMKIIGRSMNGGMIARDRCHMVVKFATII